MSKHSLCHIQLSMEYVYFLFVFMKTLCIFCDQEFVGCQIGVIYIFLQSWVCFVGFQMHLWKQFPPNRSDAEQNLVVAEIGNKDLKFICLLFLSL